MAGSPSVKVNDTTSPVLSATACCWLPATVVPARPSTRTVTVVPPNAAGTRITALSDVGFSGREGLGKTSGANAGAPLAVVAENASAVSESDAW
jgi:hypothetical protein